MHVGVGASSATADTAAGHYVVQGHSLKVNDSVRLIPIESPYAASY